MLLLDRWKVTRVPATASVIGLDGLSGTLRLAHLLGQPFGMHVPALNHLLSVNPSAQPADLVSGSAGLLSALAGWEEGAADPIATAVAERLAQHCRVPQVEEAPGLAHGRSGPAIALMAAGVRWGNDDWLAQGRALLRGMASEYDPRSGGWPDGRPGHDRPMQGWCRGSAGLALVHARALALAPHAPEADEWEQVITTAAGAMMRASPTAMAATPLCCGSLGVAVALQVVGTRSSRDDWVTAGQAQLDVALGAWAQRAGQLPPGLMDGLAGLGLAALWRGKAALNFLPLLT
jgi:lantibiotic modifying enzyme